jgi:predicted nucleic acid-binding protein
LARVLARPRLQRVRRFSRAEALLYVSLIRSRATVISPTHRGKFSRDPTDDELIEIALAGRATHLVSRDADLTRDPVLIRRLAEHGVSIVTVQQFLTLLPAISHPAQE